MVGIEGRRKLLSNQLTGKVQVHSRTIKLPAMPFERSGGRHTDVALRRGESEVALLVEVTNAESVRAPWKTQSVVYVGERV